MAHTYTQTQFVDLVMRKKIPLMVQHGIAAMTEGTYRILKTTKTGKVWRTTKRNKVQPKQVSATKTGMIEALNIVTSSFEDYGYLKARKEYIVLTATKGRKQNSLHIRETDSKRRSILFKRLFESKFATEIEEWKVINS